MKDPMTGNNRPAVRVGAAVTLSTMEDYFKKVIIKVIHMHLTYNIVFP